MKNGKTGAGQAKPVCPTDGAEPMGAPGYLLNAERPEKAQRPAAGPFAVRVIQFMKGEEFRFFRKINVHVSFRFACYISASE